MKSKRSDGRSGSKVENLDIPGGFTNPGAFVAGTGGSFVQRLVRNNYGKKDHAAHDQAAKEAFGTTPDVSGPWIIGGTR